ncbi:MAG: phosphatidylglycerophosphatase A [Candidatus Cloacimonetes bacterium]|nr:phosphatidylglycerophosphatase A [Candidatus Cloacimonadota bacterium]
MSRFFSKVNLALATALGVGYIPWAPGTFGTAFALALAVLFPALFWQSLWGLGLVVAFSFVTAGVCGLAEQRLGHDNGRIVLDEVAGMWVALLFLPRVWWVWLAAFILFRLFDITKPLGIGKLQSFKGGWGVMLDDIGAGLAANLLVQLAVLALHISPFA